jgi:hypothetical protein
MRHIDGPWPEWVEYPKDEAERQRALEWLERAIEVERARRAAWFELGRRLRRLFVLLAPFLLVPALGFALAWALWGSR